MRGTRLAAALAIACTGLTVAPLAAAAQTLALRGTESPNRPNSGLLGGSLFRSDPMATRFDETGGAGSSDIGSPRGADGVEPALRTTLGAASGSANGAERDPFAAANQPNSATDDTVTDDQNAGASTQSGAATAAGGLPANLDAETPASPDTANPGGDNAEPGAVPATPVAADAQQQEPATTGTIPERPIDQNDQERNSRAERANQREPAIESLLKAKPEDDPYAPLGIRAGGFILRPSLETGLTATTNANSSAGGKGAVLSESTLRLNATSDWSENTATIEGFGTWRKSISGQDVSDPSAGINASLSVPLANGFVARGTFGYSLTPESPSSPGFISGTVGEPLTQSITGSLGLDKEVGRLRLGLTGNVERDTYGDAKLVGGGTVSQHDRDSTLVSATLRTGYEISPALVPFVEGEIGRRYYDLTTDSAGYDRSADRIGIRAGVALDFGDKLRGELSAGYIREKADDSRLPAIAGPSIETALNWSPVRGTTVALNGSTTVEGATDPGESGSLLYSANLSVEREIRANLTGTASLGAFYRDYVGINGHDVGWDAELGMTYWLNRYFGLTGRLRHEQLASNLPDRDYKAESVFLGIKVQR